MSTIRQVCGELPIYPWIKFRNQIVTPLTKNYQRVKTSNKYNKFCLKELKYTQL